MTIRELSMTLGEHPIPLIVLFAALPIATWIVGLLHGRGRGELRPWRYIYSLLIYSVVFPGMLVSTIIAYTLFFTGENLLDLDLLVHGLPLVAMVATLVLMSRQVKFEAVPGFDRLTGFMIITSVSFFGALAIQKTRIWLMFGGSIMTFFLFRARQTATSPIHR